MNSLHYIAEDTFLASTFVKTLNTNRETLHVKISIFNVHIENK